MSTISPKEKNMLMIIVVLVLYAVAALCYRKQKEQWKKHEKVYHNALKKYDEECQLIAAKEVWDQKYKTMCSLMPVFPYEKDVDTHWLNTMDTVASENELVISRRQTGKEEEVGDVYELPLECKNWEGTLKSLVGFLYGLRKEGAMLDVRQLFVKPSTKPGYLRGTFSLYCAYMRGDVVEDQSAADEDPAAGEKASAVREQIPVLNKKSVLNKTEPGSAADAVENPGDSVQPETVTRSPSQARDRDLRTENMKKAGGVKNALSAEEEAAAVKAALETLKK